MDTRVALPGSPPQQAEGAVRTAPKPAPPRVARLPEADLVRAAAAVLVVVIHCIPWPAQNHGLAHTVYPDAGLLARVSVPLFVVLSGILLAHSDRYRAPTPAREFWGRRLRRTLLPWVPWAVIYFVLTVRFQGMAPLPTQSWGWWTGGAGHLYFLLLIPQLYLLYRFWPKSARGATAAMGVALGVQLAAQLARVLLPFHGGWGQILMLDYGFEEAPFWVGYFGVGIVLGLRPEWRRSLARRGWVAAAVTVPAAMLLLAGLPGRAAAHWGAWVGGTGAFLRPSLVLLTVVVFADLWALAPHLRRWMGPAVHRSVRSLSRNSLGVYIIHPAFLLASGPLLEIAPRPFSLQEPFPESLLPLSLLVTSSTVLGWSASALLARWRLTGWTVGLGT
jgi:surface polysaccharide O-acyltransferase-like enzyme